MNAFKPGVPLLQLSENQEIEDYACFLLVSFAIELTSLAKRKLAANTAQSIQ